MTAAPCARPFRNGVLFMGRTLKQNTGAYYCHQSLGSKRTTTRCYIEEDLSVNVLWYNFDDIVTRSSRILDTELGPFFVEKKLSTVRYCTVLGAAPRNGMKIIFLVSRRSCFCTTRHEVRQPSLCKSLKGESNHDGTKFYLTLCNFLYYPFVTN